MNVPPILPRKQYNLPATNPGKPSAQANLTRTDHDDPEGVTADVLDNSESDSDPDITDEDRRVMHALQSLYSVRHINMARTGNSSSLVNTVTYSQLIFDSGADTSVLGQNWFIHEIYGPLINLVGFDSNVSKKKNLRLCTADTLLEHPTLGNVLLRIHHAVHNPNAQNMLLSEYQLSEYGCLIDAKPTHHKYPNGQFGTQKF